MRHAIRSRLAALGLTAALLVPAFAAGGVDTFTPTPKYPGFSDVPLGQWYTEDVRTAVELGLMKGKGNGLFDPQGALSVAEAITMAVQVHATYTGQTFTPGGSPWYQSAVDYALENGLVLRNEFSDYTAAATRSQMAGIFAYALPTYELTRINRVADVPDLSADTDYANAIYLLYNAGVLAGTEQGTFLPATGIDRASAAAILNRIALPENRVTLNLTTPSAGTVVESSDGAFRLTFGDGTWDNTALPGTSGLSFQDDSGTLTALSYAKAGETASTLEDFAVARLTGLRDSMGGLELLVQPDTVLFRGLSAISFRYATLEQGVRTYHTVFCMENSGSYLMLTLSHSGSDALYLQLLQTAYTLDLAL